MKLTLILSMLLFNAFCMGQCIDSFGIVYRGQNGVWKVYDRNAPETYELADSIWLNDDETWIIYSYHCDSFHISNDYDVKNWSTYSEGKFTKPDIKAVLPKADFEIFNYTPDTLKLVPDFDPIFDSITINGDEEPVYHRKRDTVAVILIVIDTETGYTSTMGFFHPLDQAKNDRRIPYWIKGFQVTETQNDYFIQTYYLDENKKPLRKSILVWGIK